MASALPGDESGDCTAASGEDIAVFPAPPPAPHGADAAPLFPLAAAFAVGIALAPALPIGVWGWAAMAAIGLAAGAIGPLQGVRLLRRPGLAVGFFCLGAQALAGAVHDTPPHHVSRVPETSLAAPAMVEGWVAAPPDPHPSEIRDAGDARRVRFVAEITQLTLDGRRVPVVGRARLTAPPADLRYGDAVRGYFRLRHPRRFDNPGAFDYPAYLATQGIFLEGWR